MLIALFTTFFTVCALHSQERLIMGIGKSAKYVIDTNTCKVCNYQLLPIIQLIIGAKLLLFTHT